MPTFDTAQTNKRRVHFHNSSLLQNNPYVDSFPRGSPLSPYAPANARLDGGLKRSHLHSLSTNRTSRTTKKAQKLVLFPETEAAAHEPSSETDLFGLQQEPVTPAPETARTLAEETSRDHRLDLPRVTAYCCGETYDLEEVAKFLKELHGVNAQTYDECLYASYEPATKCAVLGSSIEDVAKLVKMTATFAPDKLKSSSSVISQIDDHEALMNLEPHPDVTTSLEHNLLRSEVFIFDYGVIVFWNFFELEELNYVDLLKEFCTSSLHPNDIETEELHFQYDTYANYNKPRIYNDMITLKGTNPLVKLTISHGLAQSVKLSWFENVMEEKIENTLTLPKQLAEWGQVKMNRTSVMKIVGDLFDFRMNVNLISNVLDTPELFWVERELQGLYMAIRGYFEISQRAALLNKRVEVVSDLLTMLSDHKASDDNTQITWIVIVLVAGCVVVAFFEVWMKLVRLEAEDGL